MSARDEILARVRSALAGAAALEPPPSNLPRPAILDATAARKLLGGRLRELGADVRETGASSLAQTIEAICATHAARRAVVPDDWPTTWTPGALTVEREGGRHPRELEGFDCSLTAARLGIAESGSLAFDGGPRQGGRLLTLMVDLHVCVLASADVVDSLDTAMTLLRPAPGEAHALTLVSGPSATTDIELTRIEGVHGPRRLAVVLLEG